MTAAALLRALRQRGARVVTAESCTGGLVASALTDVGGASDVVWGGFVTYQADAKRRLLRVRAAKLRRHGEVSRATAVAMAEGALAHLPPGPGYAVATTGNAGPTGDPVGRCWIAVAARGRPTRATELRLRPGPRRDLKDAFARHALRALASALAPPPRVSAGKGAGSVSKRPAAGNKNRAARA